MTMTNNLLDNISSYEFKQYDTNFDRYMIFNRKTHILNVFFIAKDEPEKYNIFIKQYDTESGASQHINYDEWGTKGADISTARKYWNKLVEQREFEKIDS